MDLLDILPSRDGYAMRDGSSNLTTRLKGGLSRSRRDLLAATYEVDLQWNLNRSRWETLKAFHDTHQGVTFLMDLITDQPTLTRHEVNFIPGSFQLNKVEGSTFTVSAAIEVVPDDVDADMDETIMLLFETYGSDEPGSEALLLALAELVNVDLPAGLS